MSAEVIAALVAGAFTVQAAGISAVGVIVSRLVKRETASVRNEVTPNDGKSAHDQIIRHVDNVRVEMSRKVDQVNRQHVRDWHT